MPAWPALVKFRGQAELLHVADAKEWQALRPQCHGAELLIDANGEVYAPETEAPAPLGRRLELAQVLELVRAHAALGGQCCTAKLAAPTIRAAINAVEAE